MNNHLILKFIRYDLWYHYAIECNIDETNISDYAPIKHIYMHIYKNSIGIK